MALLLSLFLGCSIATLTWFLTKYLNNAWLAYSNNVSAETSRTFDDVFIFLDIAKLKVLACFLAALSALVIAWLLGRWWGILPALIILLFLPKFALSILRNKRLARFDAQLPDLLMSIAGAIKAGAGLHQALQSIINSSEGPIQQEFSLLIRQQRLGLDFQQSLEKLSQRVPTESCALLVSALSIAMQTGGSVAEVLINIATAIRTRLYWEHRVKALTAQGRMQSVIMAALPVLLLFVLSYMQPEEMSLLWNTWYGWGFLLAIFILEALGIVWIRRIASIEI